MPFPRRRATSWAGIDTFLFAAHLSSSLSPFLNVFLLADSWHLYNDRAVSGASKDTVISYEAYLLFYQKAAAEVRMQGPNRIYRVVHLVGDSLLFPLK